MSDEPKQEADAPEQTKELSKTKSLTLQPSAEFAAEQASQTGPQISLPSSPAPNAAPDPAVQAAATPSPATPVTSPPATPVTAPAPQLPDPLNMPQTAPAPAATEVSAAQPVVPAAFQTPEQVAAAAKAQPSHSQPASQQFMLTSEMANAESEAQASAALLETGAAVLGFASSLSFIGLTYFVKNLWVIGGVCTLLAVAAIIVAFMSYRRSDKVTPFSVIGIAAATVTLVYVGNALVTYLAIKSAAGNFMY